jgi:hypothetical protein
MNPIRFWLVYLSGAHTLVLLENICRGDGKQMGAVSQQLVEHIGRYFIRYLFHSLIIRLRGTVWKSKT